jgi:hypothetical protein
MVAVAEKELADLCDGSGAAGIGVADAFVNASEGFLIFVLADGGRIVQVEFLSLSHGTNDSAGVRGMQRAPGHSQKTSEGGGARCLFTSTLAASRLLT